MEKLTGRRRCRTVVALAAAAWVALAGCDQQRIAKLEEGVATEADVRAQFGEPEAVHAGDDGSRTLEYPRQPQGQTNYFITIGADGRLSALRQVLKPENFAQVTAGLDKVEVRRLLGRPARTQPHALLNQEVWEWHWADGNVPALFVVTFDGDGRVMGTMTSVDRERELGGRH